MPVWSADNRYGAAHRRKRREWAQRIANGARPICARCGYEIGPNDAWHLDHADDGVTYLGPSHAWCNTSAGGKRSRHNKTITPNLPTTQPASREW